MLAAFLTTLLFSVSAVSGSRSARLVGGTEANFWRLIVATLFLGLVAHAWGSGLDSIAFPLFLLSGCVGFGIGDAMYFQALPRIGSRLASMMVLCLSAPLAALVEWLWMGTGLTVAEGVAGLVILIGVGVALAPGGQLSLPRPELWSGGAFGGIAALCQAVGAVLSRQAYRMSALAAEDIDGLTAAYQRILGGVLVMAALLLLVKRRTLFGLIWRAEQSAEGLVGRKAKWRQARPWILVNGLCGPALGVSCFQWALKGAPSGIVLAIVSITPIMIIPFARRLEGERPTGRSLGGGALAVAGAAALAFVSRQ